MIHYTTTLRKLKLLQIKKNQTFRVPSRKIEIWKRTTYSFAQVATVEQQSTANAISDCAINKKPQVKFR